MAVPSENLPSFGHVIIKGKNTLAKQREPAEKNSTWDLPKISLLENHKHPVMNLQRRLKELKERERIVQQQNRQLLQQFDASQGVLKDILASNAAMKVIRIEYERLLKENSIDWQRQINETTRSEHKKRINDHQSRDQLFTFQDFQNTAVPQHCSTYSQEHRLTLSQPRPAGLPIRSPYQSVGSSQVPPTLLYPHTFPHFHPFSGYNLLSGPNQHEPRSIPDPLTSTQAEHLLHQITGEAGITSASESSMGDLNMEEPLDKRRIPSAVRKDGMSAASRSGGSMGNILSQELDIKPSRLSSGHVDSSGSSRDLLPPHTKRKGGKTRRSSDRRSFRAASTTPLVTAPVAVGQSSDSDAPSHEGHSSSSIKIRRRGLAHRPEKMEKVEPQERKSIKENSESPREESQKVEVDIADVREKSSNEKVQDKYPEDESQSTGEVFGSQEGEEEEEGSHSDTLKMAGEGEKQETSSSEEEEENIKDTKRAGKVLENQDRQPEDEKSEGEDDEDEETGTEDGKSTQGEDDDAQNRKTGSVASLNQVADEDVGSEEEEQEEEESEEEAETSNDGESEERDSEDSIISPQEKRPKQINVIPEEAEEESKESSDADSNGFSDDAIENLLAPQEQRNEEENTQKSEAKPTETGEKVQSFQVKPENKSEGQSDSDESDHFYD